DEIRARPSESFSTHAMQTRKIARELLPAGNRRFAARQPLEQQPAVSERFHSWHVHGASVGELLQRVRFLAEAATAFSILRPFHKELTAISQDQVRSGTDTAAANGTCVDARHTQVRGKIRVDSRRQVHQARSLTIVSSRCAHERSTMSCTC